MKITTDDLEAWEGTLDTLYSFCLAQDLSNQYKNLGSRVQKSPLTRLAEKSLNEIRAYREEEEIEDNVSEE